MNVQPAFSASLRLTPASVARQEQVAARQGAQPGWERTELSDLTGFGRQPAGPDATLAGMQHSCGGDLPPQQVVAGPPLPVAAVQSGALPQDRPSAMPAAHHHPAAFITAPAGFRHFAGFAAGGWGPEGLHWHGPPPGMLTALQEGGRARIATLFP